MIAVQDVITKCNSALDAEGFDTYLFANDFQPAINYAQQWLVSLFNAAFERDKKVGEALKDLLFVKCFLTSDLSRVFFDETSVGMNLWSILNVYPNIEYKNVTGAVIPNPSSGKSLYLPDLIYLKSYDNAILQTKDKININRKNPFVDGNEVSPTFNISPEFIHYIYINHTHYGTLTYPYTPTQSEIELLPALVNSIIAIEFLKQPIVITAVNQNIEFPVSLTNIVVEKSLEWMALKQPGTGYREGVPMLKNLTTQDVQNLISILI